MRQRGASKRSRRSLLVAVSVVVLAGAGCAEEGDTATTTDAPSNGASSNGAELYQETCASCHGSDLRGTDQGPPHLSQVYAPDHHPDASFRAAITQGSPAHHWDFGDMPPIGGLTGEQIDQIIDYVRDQQEIHGLEPYPPE